MTELLNFYGDNGRDGEEDYRMMEKKNSKSGNREDERNFADLLWF